MTGALAKVSGGGGLARADDGFSQEQIETIKRTIAVGATDSELKLFVHTAQRLRLDPFARQVFFVKRKQKVNDQWIEKGETQVSIDGFRVVAERSDEYEGQDGPYWCGEDGLWKDVWLSTEPPRAAKVGVFRKGHRQPISAVALFDEYAQKWYDKTAREWKLGPMWQKMPANQLAKCAEALALRKAFPNNLSGVYTSDEMAQAANALPEPDEKPARQQLPAKTSEQRLDEIARGGERAETRPTTSTTPNASDAGSSVASPAASVTAAQTEPSQASAGPSADGELLDAKAWRKRYETVCEGAMQISNVIFGSEDEHGLPIPPFDVPTFSPKAKRHAGKTYEEVEAGFLREVIIANEGFGEQPIAKQLWALYLVTRHQIAKESGNV